MSLPQHLPAGKRGKEERRLPASELEAYRLLGCRLKMLASEGNVHEGEAAFGRLAELATRGGAAAMTTAPQEVLLQLSPSSLPGRNFVPAERCKPPYTTSREWLLAHRRHCGRSDVRTPFEFQAEKYPPCPHFGDPTPTRQPPVSARSKSKSAPSY